MFIQPIEISGEASTSIGVSALLASFTYALDLTEGQPAGHCLRACYIATRVAQRLGLARGDADYAAVFHTAMLKDLGCSSNAARLHELYKADDRSFKQDFKGIGPGLPATLRFVFASTARNAPLRQRVAAITNILRNGDDIAQELIVTRCTRGSEIARDLGFADGVCSGIYHLDEHWDGGGRPGRLAGHAIPLASRLALLAQIADVFLQRGGPDAALYEVARRAGTWLDPHLADVFCQLGRDRSFWADLASPLIEARVTALAPPESRELTEDFLDRVTDAFGKVIDAKSPFTAGHSGRVADYATALGARMDMLPARQRQLRRAAALHDIGKLGVSSAILEKPGKLDDHEWIEMRSHAAQTRAILGRIAPLAALADQASAHHERLDGAGYPLQLDSQAIGRETRIITVCDFYDALTADRPYRAAMPREKALSIIESEVGKAVDGDCFAILRDLTAS